MSDRSTPALTRRGSIALGAVVLAGMALRIAFVFHAATPLPEPGDAMAYHHLAGGLAAGDGYVRPYDRLEGRVIATAEYPPLFPTLLAVVDLVGVDDVKGQRVVMAGLGGVGILLAGLLGRRIGGPTVMLGAAALLALHPLVLQDDTTLLSEGVVVAMGAAVLLLALRALEHDDRRSQLLLGVGIGVATLARAEGLLLVLVLGLPLALAASHRARALGFVVLGTAAIVLPWGVRNLVRLDALVPVSSNVGTALDGANCPTTYQGPLTGSWRFSPDCFEGFDTAALVADGEASVSATHRDEGLSYLRHHPRRLPEVVGVRVLRAWGAWDPEQQVYLAALEGKALRWERVGTWYGWAVSALAAGGAVALRRRRAELAVLLAPVLVITVTAAATYGNPRFRALAEPSLAVLTAVALTGLATRLVPRPTARRA